MLVGVRAPLLAFNLKLGGSVGKAAAVAAAVRESTGGLPGVQALALELGHAHAVQLSTNLIDLDATSPHVLVERVVEEAARAGSTWVRVSWSA